MKKLVGLIFFLYLYAAEGSTYLDYAASAPMNELASNELLEIAKLEGNASGINQHAKILKKIEEQSTKIIADKINANINQIHFTSSATVANNIAIFGVAYKNPKCHFITSSIEHKSILNVFNHLEQKGYSVTYLDVDRYGNISLDQLKKSIRKTTKLISIQMLNSEIGALQNIKEIGAIARQNNTLFHTDASQSFCKYDIDVNEMNIDLLTISGHKIGAPKGIAAVYVRDSNKLQPILFGSGDELFPGTKPTPLIAAFASAVKNFSFNREYVNRNFHALTSELSKISNVYINSLNPSHIVSISIADVLLSDILERMKEYSFSAGCSCLGQDRSNVIAAIDPEGKLPTCTIRISFSDNIPTDQLIAFSQKLKIVVEQLRKEKSVGDGCQSIETKSQNDLNKKLVDIKNSIQE